MSDLQQDRIICLWLTSVEIALGTVSFVSITAVSIDRFFAICHPIKYHKRNNPMKTKSAVLFCWLLGIIGFLPALGWNSGKYENKCDPRVILSLSYVIFLCISVAIIPTIILAVAFFMVFRKISQVVST